VTTQLPTRVPSFDPELAPVVDAVATFELPTTPAGYIAALREPSDDRWPIDPWRGS
jgi:hypothetical protein